MHLPRSRVLVTGATGFIGGHLTERLLALGVPVRIFARNPARAAPLAAQGADVVIGDVSEPASVRGLAEGCRTVFHCAAWMGRPYTVEAAWAGNVIGTETVAAEALRAGVERFVHVSSITVYGPVRAGVVTEASPLWKGVELYGDTKIAGEETLRAAAGRGLPVVITRPGLVFGPRCRGWARRVILWLNAGFPIMVSGVGALARPIFIDNLVDALLLCAQRPVLGEAFTLIDADVLWREYLGYYGRLAGKPVRSVPYAALWLLALGSEFRARLMRTRPRESRTALGYAISTARYSTQNARDRLGWAPRISLADATAQTDRWLRENGYLRRTPHR
ncbi:MAG: NAD-dependent epimerase/dehydratase family protein [bacterium]